MSRSIGSHILLEKLVQPNWDFVRNLLVRAKIASNLLVGKGCSKDRECRTNMAAIAALGTKRKVHCSMEILMAYHVAGHWCIARCIATSEACLVQIEDRLEVVVDSEVSLLLPRARVNAARITVHQRCKDMWHQKRLWFRLVDALQLDRRPRLCSLPQSITVRAPPCLLRH